jgi:hypothetical protein
MQETEHFMFPKQILSMPFHFSMKGNAGNPMCNAHTCVCGHTVMMGYMVVSIKTVSY